MTAPPTAAAAPPARSLAALLALTYVGIYGSLLMPMIYAPRLVVFPFIFAKLLALQILLALTLPAWAVLAWQDPRYRPRRSPLLGALLVYFVALAVSTAFSIDRERSFWGNQERMSGLFQLLHYFAWAVMASSVVRGWTALRRLLHFQVTVGFVMGAIAVLQRPFPSLIGEGVPDMRVAGLLGNPIFSGTYHLFVIFFLVLLWTRAERGWWRRVYELIAATSLGAIWFSGSRGPLLGLVAGAAVAALVWAVSTRRWRVLALAGVLLAAGAGAYAVVALVVVPDPRLAGFWSKHQVLQHIFLADNDPSRRNLWKVAWQGFLERPIAGWGLAAFDLLFDVHYPPWFLCRGLEETMQDSSHSLLFDHLGTTGLLGLLAFAGVWVAVLATLVRAWRARALPTSSTAALLGLCAAYLAQGLFVFDSPGVSSMVYLLLAVVLVIGHDAAPVAAQASAPVQPGAKPAPAASARPAQAGQQTPWRWAAAFLALEVAGGLSAYRTSYQPGLASYLNKEAHDAWRSGNCAAMLDYSRQAFATPTPYLDDQLFTLARNLATLAARGNLDRCQQWPELLQQARLVDQHLREHHPVHTRHRSIFTNLISSVGRYGKDPALRAEAGPLYQALIAESPRRQQYRFDYSNWLLDSGNVNEARAQLEAAMAGDPSIGEPRWRLGTLLWRNLGQARAGAELMSRSQEGSCPHHFRSSMEIQQLAQAWSLLGDKERLKSLVGFVENLPPNDRPTVVHLGIATYLEKMGLVAERDRVLDLARERDVTVVQRLAPLRDGRASTIAEAEKLTGPLPAAP